MTATNLFVVSVSWRRAPIALRERFALPEAEAGALLRALCGAAEVAEAMVLSTCNRVDIYGVAAEGADALGAAQRAWEALLARAAHASPTTFSSEVRAAADAAGVRLTGVPAVRHVFRVISSLDSLVIGEAQIVGQARQALAVAKAQGQAHAQLERVMRRALSVSRKVRRDTALGHGAASVASVAAQLAARVFGDVQGHQVLMVGAGKMSRLTGRHLRAAGAPPPMIINRSHGRAHELAAALGGQAVAWDELEASLVQADIVVSSTGAAQPVLTHAMMKRVAKARRFRPLVLIDIAVPRDVDASVAELDGMYVFDIDDLERVVSSTLEQRQAAADVASALVEAELVAFVGETTTQGQAIAPVAATLIGHVQGIVANELGMAHRRLAGRGGGGIEEAGLIERELDRSMRRIVNKIVHRPLVAMKFADAAERARLIAAIEALFGLPPAVDTDSDIDRGASS